MIGDTYHEKWAGAYMTVGGKKYAVPNDYWRDLMSDSGKEWVKQTWQYKDQKITVKLEPTDEAAQMFKKMRKQGVTLGLLRKSIPMMYKRRCENG